MSALDWFKRILGQKADEAAPPPPAEASMEVAGLNFMTAIEAHIKWKTRLETYIQGTSQEDLKVEVVCRDDQCPLGKWIYSTGGERFGTIDTFGEMRGDAAADQFHPQETRVAGQLDAAGRRPGSCMSSAPPAAASSATSTWVASCACCPACSRPSSMSASSAPPSCTWPTSGATATATGDGPRPIERILAEGQNLIVQVLKDPIGTKGARLSTQISIAGRCWSTCPRTSTSASPSASGRGRREQLRERLSAAAPTSPAATSSAPWPRTPPTRSSPPTSPTCANCGPRSRTAP
jgi:Ribonuclease G/E